MAPSAIAAATTTSPLTAKEKPEQRAESEQGMEAVHEKTPLEAISHGLVMPGESGRVPGRRAS